MQTIGIVLNVRAEQAAEFEAGFREMELPTWHELRDRGLLRIATLTKLDISTRQGRRLSPIPDRVHIRGRRGPSCPRQPPSFRGVEQTR